MAGFHRGCLGSPQSRGSVWGVADAKKRESWDFLLVLTWHMLLLGPCHVSGGLELFLACSPGNPVCVCAVCRLSTGP